MTLYKSLLSLFVIDAACSLSHVVELRFEGIVGGYDANPHSIKYQVSIQGKRNFSHRLYSICGGGIIGDEFIISAAHCFISKTNQFKEFSFSIVADTINVNTPTGFRVEVDSIYTPPFNRITMLNDIAVLKLKERLHLFTRPNVAALKLPSADESFVNTMGVVAGYGWNWVEVGFITMLGISGRIVGGTGFHLKYANVEIVNDDKCQRLQPETTIAMHICGLMICREPGEFWGVCTGDSGGPLVVNGTVVGLVIRNSADCNDMVLGCIYTKVSSFLPFIEGVLSGNLTTDTLIHRNPIYIYPDT